MSDNPQLPKLNDLMEPVIPDTDLSKKDMVRIQEFKDAGMPGIAKLTEVDYARMISLYLDGITYHEISLMTRIPKVVIMTCSQRYNWFETRLEYMHELAEKSKFRALEAKLKAQDFLLTLGSVFQKKIGKHARAYLSTDDEAHVEKIDMKDVVHYLKIVDQLQKLTEENAASGKSSTPAVGLNLGEGVTITKNGDNSVEITPKSKKIGDLLREFADSRRQTEAAKIEEKVKTSDIEKKKEKKE